VSQKPMSLMPASIPPPPAFFCMLARVILILIAAFAVFRIWRAYKSANFLKRRPQGLVNFVVYLITTLLLLFMLWLMPPIPAAAVPACVFKTLGIVALLTSLVFMVAVFWKWLADKVENFLEGQFQYTYWLIFWFVYIIGWLKGLTSIPTEGLVFEIVSLVGFAWFLVIPIIMWRATLQTGKHK